MEFNLVQTIAIYALPVIFAITLHEAAHGYVARHFGDTTAFVLGRVSLNPLRHIDMVGTIAVPLLILVVSKLFGGAGILFGWAKPVPVNFHALRHPKRDMLWVAAAGPAANLVMALGWALLMKAAQMLPQSMFSLPMMLMAEAGGFDRVDRSDLPPVGARAHVRRTRGLRHAPHGRDAPGAFPRRAQKLGEAAERVSVPVLCRRLARAYDAL